MPWWEWQDNATAWTPFFEADVGTIERLYTQSVSQCLETKDMSWNSSLNFTYRYDFRVMKQINLNTKKRKRGC